MLTLDNLTAGYDRRPAVHHLSGTFAAATLTAVIGPNGAGKSTLLKTIAGLLPPMSGTIIRANGARAVAYLPQISEIDRGFPLSVFDVALLGLWRTLGIFGGATKADRARVMHALEQVGMAHFAHRPIGALSSGQLQRALFARLILQDAALILLDEPFAAVDSRTAHDLLHLVEAWPRAGKTVIAVLHDHAQVREFFPHTLLLARECVGWGATAETLNDANLARAQITAVKWHDHDVDCTRDARGGMA